MSPEHKLGICLLNFLQEKNNIWKYWTEGAWEIHFRMQKKSFKNSQTCIRFVKTKPSIRDEFTLTCRLRYNERNSAHSYLLSLALLFYSSCRSCAFPFGSGKQIIRYYYQMNVKIQLTHVSTKIRTEWNVEIKSQIYSPFREDTHTHSMSLSSNRG